jgi:hypothetical protein
MKLVVGTKLCFELGDEVGFEVLRAEVMECFIL